MNETTLDSQLAHRTHQVTEFEYQFGTTKESEDEQASSYVIHSVYRHWNNPTREISYSPAIRIDGQSLSIKNIQKPMFQAVHC